MGSATGSPGAVATRKRAARPWWLLAGRIALVGLTVGVLALTWFLRAGQEKPVKPPPQAPAHAHALPATPPPGPPPEGVSPHEWLAHLTNPQDPREVRLAALRRLLEFSPGTARQPVIDLLRTEPGFPDRGALIRALVGFEGEEITGILAEAVQREPDAQIRRFAAAALSQRPASEPAVGVLRAALRGDPDRELRIAALRSLWRLRPPGVEEDLRGASESDPDEHVRALAALLLGNLSRR